MSLDLREEHCWYNEVDWDAALLSRVLLADVSIWSPVVDTMDFLRPATEAMVVSGEETKVKSVTAENVNANVTG